MPCYSDYNDEVLTRLNLERDELEALFCGVTSTLEKMNLLDRIFNLVDWQEVGLPERIARYYIERHKEKDRVRKQTEEQKRITEYNKQRALSKLNEEERKALGLK